MDKLHRFRPGHLYGKPSIRGTRIGVDLILEKLAAGITIPQLLKAYTQIKEDLNLPVGKAGISLID
ncbi:MAG: DUF433 domain-containing protein [Saprospiraceae bacterium]|nr:DUF433 domain-containing protein [Saprospiraceae bacterium]